MRVVVLGGGRSSEHEVSLESARAVRDGLATAGHEVVAVEIGRDGVWRGDGVELVLRPACGLLEADVVFPVLHGPFGEDGTVQGLLECLDVPYVGAGVMASAICIDKLVFKQLMASTGLPQVEHAAVVEDRFRDDREAVLAALAELGLPVFVKPARLGSSVGIVKVSRAEDLAPAIEQALRYDPRVIVEASSSGLEVECSVIGISEPLASEPGEIVISNDWYDYEAKYQPGGMELVVPARIAAAARDRVRELTIEAFVCSGCSGMARVDFFVDGDRVVVNELNTIPGFTSTSVFAKLFEASGLPYAALLDRLLGFAIERYRDERRHSF
ncbi:MAG TPA: D-alanine--D-alanine ligase family protein [Solirubrobacteraceae bacterium]|nr:D-alanine--D-alanine ligase family protein [Solirubrobacteraceae bacterium]